MKEQKGNLAVIGSGAEMMLFRMTGARVCITDEASKAREALHDFIHEGAVIVLISDELYPEIIDIAEQYRESIVPVIAVLPGKEGLSENSDRILYDSVRKAIGFDITEIIRQ